MGAETPLFMHDNNSATDHKMLYRINIIRTSLARMTQGQRAALVFLIIGSLIGLATKFPELVGITLLISTLVVFIKELLFRIYELNNKIRRPLFRRAIRIVRVMRRFFSITPEVELLHISTILLVLVSFVYILATKTPSKLNALGQVLLFIVFIAAAADTGNQVAQLTKSAWAKTIGKIILAGVGATLFYVATALSKQIVHGITATDPKFYSEFCNIFSALAMPLLYLLLGSLVLVGWGIFQLGIAFLVMVLASTLGLVTANAPAWKLFLYRLQQGKRPPKNYRAPTVDFRWIVVWMRPVSLIFSAGMVLSALVYVINEYGKSIELIVTKSLVAVEYRHGSKCFGLPARAEVAYLERGMVSVVTQEDNNFTFSTQKCELPKE